jgi:hypothetical protein
MSRLEDMQQKKEAMVGKREGWGWGMSWRGEVLTKRVPRHLLVTALKQIGF